MAAVITLPGAPAIVSAMESQNPAGNLAQCAWTTSEGARLTARGNEIDLVVSTLPEAAPRAAVCWAALPGSGPMIVHGLHHGAVTETGWTFAFERSNAERVDLYRGSQEREFAFPIPAGWEHDKRIGIVIGIPGDNPGYLHLRDLRLQPSSNASLANPELVSPTEGQEVTAPAADFLWSCPQPGQVAGYDLEWRPGGGDPQKVHVAAYFTSDAQGYWPHEWLSPGIYSWRVRAQNLAGSYGPWSEMKHFVAGNKAPAQPLVVTPSATRPVTILNLPYDDVKGAWSLVPADLRSSFLFRTGGARPYIAQILSAAQEAEAPIALQTNGPHNIIAGRWDRVPLAMLEQWAHHYSSLKAFYICEQQVQGGMNNPEVADYLERLMALGAETGRPVFWADANWGKNIWLEVEAHQEFMDFMKKHYGYVFPLWKMNGGDAIYLAPAGLLGLWLSHIVAGWGAQPESYYWTEAGFTTIGKQLDYKEGVRTDAPTVLFQQLALLGASAGAQVYSFEPANDYWDPRPPHADLVNLIWPLFRMLDDAVVPNLAEVQAATVEQHVLDSADLDFRCEYTRPVKQLFSRTLGIAYPSEMVPESGSCYWIPFMPSGSEVPRGEPPCPPPASGKAAVFKAGRSTFVFNSRVNWNEEQSFSLNIAGTNATGELGTNGWVTLREGSNHQARLWFFARHGSYLVIDFDRPVTWRRLDDAISRSPNGVSPDRPLSWSGPVQHLDFAADQNTWDIAIRLAQ
jgi:hypothetical protein